MIWATAMMAMSSVGACAPTAEMPAPNAVRYDVDGMNVVIVGDGFTSAFVDETKHRLGPNTRLLVEAATLTDTPELELGDMIRVNVPAGMSVGEHDVRFAPLPGRESVWVSYRSSESASWSAYQGTIALEQLDSVGGRFKASFSELDLVDSCGQRRQLTNGSLDVRVGSEDAVPVSGIDMSDTSEWAQLGVAALIENNLIIELDDKLVACPFIDFGPKIVPAADSGTGRDEEVLEVVAACGCNHDGPDGIRPLSFGLIADLPISGHGDVAADGTQFSLSVSVDLNRTPDNGNDDESWFALAAPQLRYQDVGGELGARIDIELTAPLILYNFDQGGPPRTKRLSMAHMYGVVNRSLGQ